MGWLLQLPQLGGSMAQSLGTETMDMSTLAQVAEEFQLVFFFCLFLFFFFLFLFFSFWTFCTIFIVAFLLDLLHFFIVFFFFFFFFFFSGPSALFYCCLFFFFWTFCTF